MHEELRTTQLQAAAAALLPSQHPHCASSPRPHHALTTLFLHSLITPLPRPYHARTTPFTTAPHCCRRRRRRTRRGCRRRRRSSRRSCASRRRSCAPSRPRYSPPTRVTRSSYGSSGAACWWRSAACLPAAASCSRRETWAPPTPTPRTRRKVPRRACARRVDGPMDVKPGEAWPGTAPATAYAHTAISAACLAVCRSLCTGRFRHPVFYEAYTSHPMSIFTILRCLSFN